MAKAKSNQATANEQPATNQAPPSELEYQAQFLMNEIVRRRELASYLGKQFGGDRDLYDTLGYPKSIDFEDYRAKYERQDIAGRVVDAPAKETWRKPPTILDGAGDAAQETTPFTEAFNKLAAALNLWHYFSRLDRLSGIGRFGVMLIGLRGQSNLEAPAEKIKSADDVIYLSVFDEGAVEIKEYVDDPGDNRFGLPEVYEVDLGEKLVEGAGATKSLKKKVHHTRIIHVAEDVLEDEVFGTPRMKRVFNRLMDLEKVVGGGAEAQWKLAYKGIILEAEEGARLPEPGSDEAKDREAAIREFVHNMTRILDLEGSKARFEGGESVDPTGMFNTIISIIAGETEIPQRILLGSERGDLASSQDAASWAGVIEERRNNFAEPVIIGQFVKRLQALGGLPETASDEGWSARWEPLFELTALEEAEIAVKASTAIKNIAPAGAPDLIVDGPKFVGVYLPKLAEAQITVDEEAMLDEEESEMDESEAEAE